jgi:predicted PurR-regulated permease PerM
MNLTDKNTTIVISSGTIIKTILIGILFVLIYMLRDLVLVLLTSVVIASSIEPITKLLCRYKINRVIAVIFIYLAVFLSFVGIVYFFVPPLLNETSKLVSSLPQYIESIDIPLQAKNIGIGSTGNFVGGLSETLSIKEAIASFESAISSFSGGTIQVVSFVFGGIFSFILIVIISFYLSVQEKGIENFLRIITPIKHEFYIIDLWKRTQGKIGKWMQGQLLLGLLIGVLVYLGLTILGVQYAFILAVAAAVAELIPLFGPTIAAVPAVAIGFSDSITLGFMVLGLYVIIQQFENHLIYPLVVRKVVGVPPLLIILALIIGAQLAGFLGIILAVPFAAALIEITDDIQKEKKKITNS